MKKKTLKEVKIDTFSVCASKSQDFAQNQKFLKITIEQWD